MIDVLVLNYNDVSTTIQFVESMVNYSCVRKILVVDNCSTDKSFDELLTLRNSKVVVVQTEKNGGYGAGNNFGIRYLYNYFKSEYILLCNPDVIVSETVCANLESFLIANQKYAIVAPFMLNAKGVKQSNTAFRIPSKWEYIKSIDLVFARCTKSFYFKDVEKETNPVKDVGCVSGSLFLMRASDMIDFGMYDENIFLYCEELVLGIKMSDANKKTALLTECSFLHNHSVSISKTYKSYMARRKLFMKSKLYVIKQYYHANFLEYSVAWVLSKISTVELFLNGLLRGR